MADEIDELAERAAQLVRDFVRLALRAARPPDRPERPPAPAPMEVTQLEAARLRRVPIRALRFLTRTRRLPFRRQGRDRVILLADLDALLAEARRLGVPLHRMSRAVPGAGAAPARPSVVGHQP